MLDITLRPLKDKVFDPLCALVPRFISPLFVTLLAFLAGLASCYYATLLNSQYSIGLWFANRALDCLDGALARRRNQASDLGGFLDLLGDFIIYALIPISCAIGIARDGGSTDFGTKILDWWSEQGASQPAVNFGESGWLSVATVEASFFINNFVLFFIAAILEKRRANADEDGVRELTTVAMRPALIEGFESGVLFTLMLSYPSKLEMICWVMTSLVGFGTLRRVIWIVAALNRTEAHEKAR